MSASKERRPQRPPPVEEDRLSDPLPASPLPLLRAWFEEARAFPGIRNADAMALSTVDAEGRPEVRFVLCRGFDDALARFTFFTHYASAKGQALEHMSYASAALYWDPLGRQARISGPVRKSSTKISDDYFASRPPPSQLAAWASEQSRPIADRAALEARLAEVESELGREGEAAPIPRPPSWGGFTIDAEKIELWSDRAGRLHDRAVWTRELAVASEHADDAQSGGVWTVQRLQP